jgi:hypothetical protein
MLNLLILTEKIDTFIFENDELKKEQALGSLADKTNTIMYSKFPTLRVELKPHSSYKIVTRLTNTTGRINPKWIIMSEEEFYKFVFQDYIIWGFILGVIFLLLLLHIFLYATLKIYTYKSYLFCVFIILFYLIVNNGFIMMTFGSGMYNNYLAMITGYLPFIFYILFLNEYFRISDNKKYKFLMKIMYAYAIYLAFSSFAIVYSNALYVYEDYYMILTFIWSIILFILTLKKSYKQNISKLIIIGELSLIVSFVYSSFTMDSEYARVSDQQLSGVFAFVQILLFVIVIFAHIFKQAKLKDKTDKLILSQSHFSTIGQTLRNIAHQWKIPSVRLGALITEMESIFYTTNFSNKRADEILDEMRSNSNFMKETITDFSTFYTNKKRDSDFILINVINDIKLMLIEKMNHASFIINCDENLSILSMNGNSRTFAHVCMIIIDNSIDIANQREIKHPFINISAKKYNDDIIIVFEDNCGVFYRNLLNQYLNLK